MGRRREADRIAAQRVEAARQATSDEAASRERARIEAINQLDVQIRELVPRALAAQSALGRPDLIQVRWEVSRVPGLDWFGYRQVNAGGYMVRTERETKPDGAVFATHTVLLSDGNLVDASESLWCRRPEPIGTYLDSFREVRKLGTSKTPESLHEVVTGLRQLARLDSLER